MSKEMDQVDRERLIEILTGLKSLQNDVAEIKVEQRAARADSLKLSLVEQQLQTYITKFDEFVSQASKKYVTHDQFEPIRRIFWIVVGVVVSGLVGALIALVVI